MPIKNQSDLMEKIVSLAKRRGFIFQSSEIYGGLGSCYDYGPLGVELKNNIKRAWWKAMVQERDDVVGLDTAILMHPKVWEASGHLENFTDPLVDCKDCHRRFKATDYPAADGAEEYLPKCPYCGGKNLEKPRDFNLMMPTKLGPVEEEGSVVYLRPETCQGIYVNFENVMQSSRQKIPFGIAQIGKAFRNEITPGNFIFRTREFEQMEMQYFIQSQEVDKYFDHWKQARMDWYLSLGIKKENLRFHEHAKDELAHYAKKAFDIEYQFPWGWQELEGIHYRGDWDLSRHQQFSQKELAVRDNHHEKYIPHVVETSGGIDRATLAVLADAYAEIEGGRTTTTESTKEQEVVLRLAKNLAPIKVAIFPLSKKPELTQVAHKLHELVRKEYMSMYDEVASIGRRYRRQDEIGTPYGVTVDFETLEDKAVTVRDRDTMKQDRMKMAVLMDYLRGRFS